MSITKLVGAGVTLAILLYSTSALAQVMPSGNTEAATTALNQQPAATTPANAGGMSAEEAAQWRQRYPVGLYVPAGDMDQRTPPRFYQADQLLTGVNINGSNVRYTPRELEGLALQNVTACESAAVLGRRLDQHASDRADNNRRRAEREQNAQERQDSGDGSGKRGILGAIATGVGYLAGGWEYAVIVGIGQLIGWNDHEENQEDRATFNESTATFNEEVDYLSEVHTTDLMMRASWITAMDDVWCPAMNEYRGNYTGSTGS